MRKFEISATSYGGTHSGTVGFVLEEGLHFPQGATLEQIRPIAQVRAREELRDSGYDNGLFDLTIDELAGRSDSRPSWEEYFLGIAQLVATRATCPRLHVGCVLVKDNRILTTGYNGSPRGVEHCDEVGCMLVNDHCMRATHAEANAVVQGALHGVNLDGSTAYCTHQPCVNCSKLLISAGVRKVVYQTAYPDPIAQKLLTEAGAKTKLAIKPALEPAQ